MNPGQWSFVTIGDYEMLIVSCPDCWQQMVVEHSRVDADGNVERIECVYLNCDFNEACLLEGWTP